MNFRHKKRYASRLETASVIKIVTENGRVRYGIVDKFGALTVSFLPIRSEAVTITFDRYFNNANITEDQLKSKSAITF